MRLVKLGYSVWKILEIRDLEIGELVIFLETVVSVTTVSFTIGGELMESGEILKCFCIDFVDDLYIYLCFLSM